MNGKDGRFIISCAKAGALVFKRRKPELPPSGGIKKVMEMEDTEFIRRFAQRLLPSGFVRIRHYGILSSTGKKVYLPSIREQIGTMKVCFIDKRKVKPFDPKICPCCGNPTMITVEIISARGPPKQTASGKLNRINF